MERSKPEMDEELPTAEQAKLNGQNENDQGGEQPAKEFLEPHLACEIYSALPIAHLHRLLTLCRAIAEKGPSPDEWTKWKIFTWTRNRWDANNCGDYIVLSPDGLAISSDCRARRQNGPPHTALAIHSAFPPIASQDPLQICYFEAKYVPARGLFVIGFYLTMQLIGNLIGMVRTIMACSALALQVCMYCIMDLCGQPGDVVGCGLLKQHSDGKRRIFFTKNEELLASVPLSSDTPNPLFPAIRANWGPGQLFEDTNFGLKPFVFKYKGNEQKLLNGLGRDFEKEEA